MYNHNHNNAGELKYCFYEDFFCTLFWPEYNNDLYQEKKARGNVCKINYCLQFNNLHECFYTVKYWAYLLICESFVTTLGLKPRRWNNYAVKMHNLKPR